MEANFYTKKVEYGQDIYDLCIQEYGSIETVFLLLGDNPSIDLETQLASGQELVFRIEMPVAVPRNENIDYFRTSKTRVNNKDLEILFDNDNIPFSILTTGGNTITTNSNQAILYTEPQTAVVGNSTIVASDGSPILQNNASPIATVFDTSLIASNGGAITDSTGNNLLAVVNIPLLKTATGNTIYNSFGNYIKTK